MKTAGTWFNRRAQQNVASTTPRMPTIIRSGPRSDGGTAAKRNPASENSYMVVGETPIGNGDVVGK